MKRVLLLAALFATVGCSSEPENSTDDNVVFNNQVDAVGFADLRVEEIGPTRAVARFDTTIPTSCEAEYGLAEDALDETATDPDMAEGELSATHQVPFEDLSPETTYFWRAKVEDDGGNVTYSEVLSFETAAAEAGPTLINYALTGAVTAVSSNFGGGENDSSWGANNAFDGQMSTEWASNGDGDDAMLEIDLGESRSITRFAFRSRKMSDGTSIIEQVQLRFDGGEPLGPFDTPDPDQRYEFELEVPISAQVVAVEALSTSGGNTGAKEIELLGQ